MMGLPVFGDGSRCRLVPAGAIWLLGVDAVYSPSMTVDYIPLAAVLWCCALIYNEFFSMPMTLFGGTRAQVRD
jgi:hypothetical protein